MAQQQNFTLKGATLVIPPGADEVHVSAARELQRFLYTLTGVLSSVVETLHLPQAKSSVVVVLGGPLSEAQGTDVADSRHDQGFHIQFLQNDTIDRLVINAHTSAGLLYAVYALLEDLGMGFYAGGETYPDVPSPAVLPRRYDLAQSPAFAVRGNMLHYNFLCGPTCWGAGDYKFYFDQLARMRCNTLLMHWYDSEPGAAYHMDGEYLTGGVTPNSLSKPWGATAALRTSEFTFGSSRFFDAEIFSSPAGEDLPDLLTEVRRTEEMFSEATRYAQTLAIRVAAGFEAPRGDPTDSAEEVRFRARIQQFLSRNPYLSYFALWQHESGGCVGSKPPVPGSPGFELLESRRAQYAYLGNEQRVWEAIRFGRFAEIAVAAVAAERPHLPVVLVGWGGDRWMQFADYCLAYDQLLPDHVIFTCHDNIDASFGPAVSTPWGQLRDRRERWAMPWVEGDIDDCQVRQPHVESLGHLAPDALEKGCQGMLTLQWRTRDVEEETGYVAQFAWDPKLRPQDFYAKFAADCFGREHADVMAAHIGTLQRLGARWTGVRGTTECGAMRWTGWVPHFPFEVDGTTADYLLPKMEDIINMLAEVPDQTDTEAAFHLIQEETDDVAEGDMSRLGVTAMMEVKGRLSELRGLEEEDLLRDRLRAIEESVYELRPQLVAYGMTGRAYRAIDGFLIAIHHLQRNAGATSHCKILSKIREELTTLREDLVAEGKTHRLERLDYLVATMDFVMNHDRVAMLLADGEVVEREIAAAEAASDKDPGEAAAIAADVLGTIVEAGMQQAIEAFTNKLTTRCDFGVLCTLNVKPLPVYWQTIDRLARLMPAAPPHELTARGKATEIWLSWSPGRCEGQRLYRRELTGTDWARVNREPLRASCEMFVDRPPPGNYVYALTALDGAGFESPRSHSAHSCCGPEAMPPRIIACKPFAHLFENEDLCVRTIVLSDRSIDSAAIMWRSAGAECWQRARMHRRFRDGFFGTVTADELKGDLFEYYVVAEDSEGRRTTWPRTAPGMPWTLSRGRRTQQDQSSRS